ncbi:TPA: hypothetical protein ACG03W_004589, partial [Escherichia coli]
EVRKDMPGCLRTDISSLPALSEKHTTFKTIIAVSYEAGSAPVGRPPHIPAPETTIEHNYNVRCLCKWNWE